MNYLTFWHYVRQQGLETRELVVLVLGVAVLIFSGFGARKLWRDMRQQKPLTYADVLAPFMTAFISAVCFFLLYWGVRTRYLLHTGTARYTVGRIFKYGNNRGDATFVYEYYVAGQRYQSYRKCGVKDWQELPCPALDNRYYIRFAPESPGTEEFTDVFVPDSVRTIPPLGWAKLP